MVKPTTKVGINDADEGDLLAGANNGEVGDYNGSEDLQ